MSLRRHNIASLLLAILIALTSVTMAVARGQMRDATGTMVLCTGAGAVTVQVDANGEPVGPAHICPDCAIGAFDTLDVRFDMPAPFAVAVSVVYAESDQYWHATRAIRERARGPPLA